MGRSTTKLYHTDAMRAPISELLITLHASNPYVIYIADTYLSRTAALRKEGIEFMREGNKKPESREPTYVK
jgi:hypothetical protein